MPKVYYGTPLRQTAAVMLAAGLSLVSTPVAAQHQAGDAFVAARGGLNVVGNTYRVRYRRPEPGGGASAGVFLSPQWVLELEGWVRSSNPECCAPRRREALYSASVVRLLTRGGLQPYMVGGISVLQSRRREMQVQVGLGVQLPLRSAMDLAVDLRGNGGGSTMIVRPTVALIYHFRRQ